MDENNVPPRVRSRIQSGRLRQGVVVPTWPVRRCLGRVPVQCRPTQGRLPVGIGSLPPRHASAGSDVYYIER